MEFRNVGGLSGWLYPDFKKLEAAHSLTFDRHVVALENASGFWLVDLERLRNWAESAFDLTTSTSVQEDALHKRTPKGKRLTYARREHPQESVGYLAVDEFTKLLNPELWS